MGTKPPKKILFPSDLSIIRNPWNGKIINKKSGRFELSISLYSMRESPLVSSRAS
jgi:hypothetical protein